MFLAIHSVQSRHLNRGPDTLNLELVEHSTNNQCPGSIICGQALEYAPRITSSFPLKRELGGTGKSPGQLGLTTTDQRKQQSHSTNSPDEQPTQSYTILCSQSVVLGLPQQVKI